MMPEEPAVAISQQRRGRSIAMTPAELDEFLTQARTCRVATLAPDGPHVVPLWFVWAGGALWLSSVVRSQRWTDLVRDPRVAVVVDAGEEYQELRGAEIRGTAGPVGEVPRRGADDAQLAEPELLFARKYLGGDAMLHDGRHGWLRVTPDKITSWDFRKLPAERAQPGH
jgi:Pyridoxamine 5'-phosphate oxidase